MDVINRLVFLVIICKSYRFAGSEKAFIFIALAGDVCCNGAHLLKNIWIFWMLNRISSKILMLKNWNRIIESGGIF